MSRGRSHSEREKERERRVWMKQGELGGVRQGKGSPAVAMHLDSGGLGFQAKGGAL